MKKEYIKKKEVVQRIVNSIEIAKREFDANGFYTPRETILLIAKQFKEEFQEEGYTFCECGHLHKKEGNCL